MQGPIVGNPIRVTMFIKTPNKTLSETHWATGTSGTPKSVLTAATVPGGIVQLRANLLGNDSNIQIVRASKDNVFRDSTIATSHFNPAGSTSTTDPAVNCLNVRLESGDLYRRTLYLGALPDVVIVDGKYDYTSPHYAKVRTYLNALSSGSWGFLAVDKGGAPLTNPQIPIAGITANTAVSPNVITVITLGPHGLTTGDAIRISQVTGQFTRQFLGTWFVDVATATTLILRDFPTLALTPVIIKKPGFLHTLKRVVQAYDNWGTLDLTSRKRGARTFLPRGRSLNRTVRN